MIKWQEDQKIHPYTMFSLTMSEVPSKSIHPMSYDKEKMQPMYQTIKTSLFLPFPVCVWARERERITSHLVARSNKIISPVYKSPAGPTHSQLQTHTLAHFTCVCCVQAFKYQTLQRYTLPLWLHAVLVHRELKIQMRSSSRAFNTNNIKI